MGQQDQFHVKQASHYTTRLLGWGKVYVSYRAFIPLPFWNIQVIFHCYVFRSFYFQRHTLKTFPCFLHAMHKIHDNSKSKSTICEQFYDSEGDQERIQSSACRMPIPAPQAWLFRFFCQEKEKTVICRTTKDTGSKPPTKSPLYPFVSHPLPMTWI